MVRLLHESQGNHQQTIGQLVLFLTLVVGCHCIGLDAVRQGALVNASAISHNLIPPKHPTIPSSGQAPGCHSNGLNWYDNCSGRIRTDDLWVMSPASFHCSTERYSGCLRRVRREVASLIRRRLTGVGPRILFRGMLVGPCSRWNQIFLHSYDPQNNFHLGDRPRQSLITHRHG